ncbi:MAG: type II toxin-antitoxin system VapC family toxin [Candidatus Latescibacteria bacterium]|jgi:PIN domain nuclease of toxin-antitoxin system|nr:type II toxin-antitoxin system VapC family toxin [Candidatus Latescibacterota bacterium]
MLLDTCTFIWMCAEPEQLSATARNAIEASQARLCVSDVSSLEIALKWSAGKIALPDPPRRWIEAQVAVWGLECVPLRREDIYRAGELPDHHRDPFDRLLVGTALNANATILTPDQAIHQYPVSCSW